MFQRQSSKVDVYSSPKERETSHGWVTQSVSFSVKGAVPHATLSVFQQGTICHKIWNKPIGSRTFDPRKPGSSAAKQAKTKVFLGFTWQVELSKFLEPVICCLYISFIRFPRLCKGDSL